MNNLKKNLIFFLKKYRYKSYYNALKLTMMSGSSVSDTSSSSSEVSILISLFKSASDNGFMSEIERFYIQIQYSQLNNFKVSS